MSSTTPEPALMYNSLGHGLNPFTCFQLHGNTDLAVAQLTNDAFRSAVVAVHDQQLRFLLQCHAAAVLSQYRPGPPESNLWPPVL